MTVIFDRALPATGRAFTRAVAAGPGTPPAVAPPPPVAVSSLAHQGRGSAQMALADRIGRQAMVAREDVTPEMEPFSPSLTDEEPGEDFTDNEDVTDEMEPFDPSIESAFKATVTGDESEVTITADDGETIVAVTGDDEDVHVEIEDTADVLLGFDARVLVEGDEDQVTISAEGDEVLDVSEVDGAVIVEVDET